MFSRMNKLNRIRITGLALLLCNLVAAQDKILPAKLEPFLLPGHELPDFVSGDLNGDNYPDLTLKNFIGVCFENSKPVLTLGYILRKDLFQLK